MRQSAALWEKNQEATSMKDCVLLKAFLCSRKQINHKKNFDLIDRNDDNSAKKSHPQSMVNGTVFYLTYLPLD